MLANGHAAQNRGIAADGGAALYPCRHANPIGVRLQFSRPGRCLRVTVVDEHHAVADEDAVFNHHAFTDEAVARDFHAATDLGALLNLDESADLAFVADVTPIQVGEGIDPDTSAQFHVGCDAHKILCGHR